MPSVNALLLDKLLAAYLRGEHLILVFDYDGTLAPFAAQPDQACLSPELRGLLARLAATPRVAVGVVSGRMLGDLREMVGLAGLYLGGTFGLKLDLRGERIAHAPPPALGAVIAELSATVEARLRAYPGAWVEKKALGFTIHYRQVSTERIEALQTECMALLEPHAATLQIYRAPLAIEAFAAIGIDKGTALQTIIAHASPDQPALVFYAGDAANDAPALAVAAKCDGIALGIGPEPPPEAAYRLPDTQELTAFLADLVAALTTVRSIA